MALDPISAGIDLAHTVVNKIWPDKTEQEKAVIAAQIQQATQEYNLANGQIEVNKIEAASNNVFIAGWRPFIGWVCGAGLAYQLLFMPILNGFINAFWKLQPFQALDTATLSAMVTALLGFGAYRTYEKRTGAEAKR